MWLKSIFRRRDGQPRTSPLKDIGEAIIVSIECDRCGERIETRLRKSSDIPRSSEGDPFEYFVQKTLVGTKCFNRIELRLEMDGRYRLISSSAKGGRLVDTAEDRV